MPKNKIEEIRRELTVNYILEKFLNKIETLENKLKYLEDTEIPALKLRLDTAEAEITFLNA